MTKIEEIVELFGKNSESIDVAEGFMSAVPSSAWDKVASKVCELFAKEETPSEELVKKVSEIAKHFVAFVLNFPINSESPDELWNEFIKIQEASDLIASLISVNKFDEKTSEDLRRSIMNIFGVNMRRVLFSGESVLAITENDFEHVADRIASITPKDVNAELLEQLDNWISACKAHAEIFGKCEMFTSETASSAMGIAYNNVKSFIQTEKNQSKQ